MNELKRVLSIIRELVRLYTYVARGSNIEIKTYKRTGEGFYASGIIYEPLLQRKRGFEINIKVKVFKE